MYRYSQTLESISYSAQEGNREESFNKATKAISFVVRSDACRFKACSTASTASDSVTCSY